MENQNIKSYERTLRLTRSRYQNMTNEIDCGLTWENLNDSVKAKLYFDMSRNLHWQNDDFAVSLHIAANNFSEEANYKIISAFVKKLNEKLLGRKYWKHHKRDEQFSCEIFKQGGGNTGIDTHFHCLIKVPGSKKVKNSLYRIYDGTDKKGIDLSGDIELLTYFTIKKIVHQFNENKKSQAIGSAYKNCKTLEEVECFDSRSINDYDQIDIDFKLCRQANDYEHDQQVYCSRYVNNYSYGDVRIV